MAISSNSTGLRPGVCTSTTRPTAPYEGQTIYETDTDKVLVWNGSAWLYSATPQTTEIGIWQSWTPVVTQGATITTSFNNSRYTQIGKTVIAQLSLTTSSAGTSSNKLLMTLPVAPRSGTDILGTLTISTSGTNIYTVMTAWFDSSKLAGVSTAGNLWGINPSGALGSGERIVAVLTYEAA